MSSGQGFTNLSDLLEAPPKPVVSTPAWGDTPVEDAPEDKPAAPAKQNAWGAVPVAKSVSIKEQMEQESKSTKPSTGNTGRTPAAPAKPASGSSAFGDNDRPSYNEGRRGGYEGGNPGRYGERSEGYNRGPSSRGGYEGGRGGYEGGSGRYEGGSGRYEGRGERREYDEAPRERPVYDPNRPSHGGRSSNYGGDRSDRYGGDRYGGDRGAGGDRYGGDRGERRERPQRAEVPFPENAPWLLFLSGLPYSATVDEVQDNIPVFFGEELAAKIADVRVPVKDGRVSHAFVEFKDADGLREALTLSGKDFLGRTVNTAVAAEAAGGRKDGRDKWGNFGQQRRDAAAGGSSFGGSNAVRKPLELAPRSANAGTSNDSSASGSSSKADPFGAAKPSDKDIYSDLPKPAAASPTSAPSNNNKPAPSVNNKPSVAAASDKSNNTRAPPTPTRADEASSWKSTNKKPSSGQQSSSFGRGWNKDHNNSGERRQYNNDNRGPRRDNNNPRQEKPAKAAPVQEKATPLDKGNIFDALNDQTDE